MNFPWNPTWRRLWRLLGIAALVCAAVLFVEFLALEAIGWFYCEANGIPGCSTLSYFVVANWGAQVVAWELGVKVGVVLIVAGVVCIVVWSWHSSDVEQRQK